VDTSDFLKIVFLCLIAFSIQVAMFDYPDWSDIFAAVPMAIYEENLRLLAERPYAPFTILYFVLSMIALIIALLYLLSFALAIRYG
jgi:hypothetical protein